MDVASVRRIMPRWVAAVGLVMASPLLAVAAIALRLSSPGPTIFRATRVGEHGRTFVMMKLRTMHLASPTDEVAPITGGADPRVFAVGSWLRRLKIDELPQLANVARGEMAFFGPRPEDPDIVDRSYVPWMRETLLVPPGVVGPGSLGYYVEQDEIPADPQAAHEYYVSVLLPRKLARDLVYVRNASTRYRCELLVRTVLGILGLRSLANRLAVREELEAGRILREVACAR